MVGAITRPRREASATDQLLELHLQLLQTRHERAHKSKARILPRSIRWFLTWRAAPALLGLRDSLRQPPRNGRTSLLRAIRAASFCGARARSVGLDPAYDFETVLARGSAYLFQEELVPIVKALNERLGPVDTADMMDKYAFFKRCRAAGLPNIPVLAAFRDGQVTDYPVAEAEVARDLFSKHAAGMRARGTAAWRYRDGHYHGKNQSFDLAGLKSHLARLSVANPIILQPRMTNHPLLAPISADGLSTARIMTVRNLDGTVDIPMATFRMATGKAVADNFGAGGIAAPIGLADGMLGIGTNKRTSATGELIRVHPDTGAPIEGFVLPHWDAAKALALAAHAEFGTMASVGWDIAIGKDGPVLVEGNGDWGVDALQLPHRKPIGDTIIPELILGHVRAAGLTFRGAQ